MRPAGGTSERGGSNYFGALDGSGKTTMAVCLSSHSNIGIPAVGSNVCTYFHGRCGNLENDENFDRGLDALMSYLHARFFDADPVRIRRTFATGSRTCARLFALFPQHCAKRRGKPWWGAQTGLIERHADPLHASHPGLKIIPVVRDPRDRYGAWPAFWPDVRGEAGGAIGHLRYSVGLAEKNLRRIPGRSKVDRFETMVEKLEETIRDVLSHHLAETGS